MGRSEPQRTIVTLTTDFGLSDSYVAQMKGVLFSAWTDAHIVDLSHEIPRHDILAGALFLREAARAFPPGTIHVAVVDPGVGSSRRRLVIQTGEPTKSYFIGPDNGLLSLAAPVSEIERIFEIHPAKLACPVPARTFEGRDIFAPAAALLARGEAIESFASLLPESGEPPREIVLKRPSIAAAAEIIGEIVRIDHFGNAITNIELGLSTPLAVFFRNEQLRLVEFYAQISEGELAALVGSSGLLELSCFKRHAAHDFNISQGETLRVLFRNGPE